MKIDPKCTVKSPNSKQVCTNFKSTEEVLQEFLRVCCEVYICNVITYTETQEQNAIDVNKVFTALFDEIERSTILQLDEKSQTYRTASPIKQATDRFHKPASKNPPPPIPAVVGSNRAAILYSKKYTTATHANMATGKH